jgi:ribosome biogenesis protein SSF1/2
MNFSPTIFKYNQHIMARRRVKKRTHLGANSDVAKRGVSHTSAKERTPKSMVVRIGAGEVGPSVSQLVKDIRSVLEPGTASRLKVGLCFVLYLRS